ncbi:uncharacterized protein LOC130741438 isoform X2 [Lotus japonicus]|uniref:uncharacterized protein LOC130741438 isoform X2 n=1 Tax=Lotus japonicus TaxID=34305 RepID=UPI0025837872|nr:uncharacterized protein LOC130741438 isoform X2 [Lotus japonicus]
MPRGDSDSDSDSKRRHCRSFHREPSPKRYRRRDGKRERDRVTTSSANDGDHRHHRRHVHEVDRSSGQRKTGERGWWKDLRNQHNERAETSQGREQRDEKSQEKPDDTTSQRRDGVSERKVDPLPTSRKRPAFREKKIPVDSADANPAATATTKSSQVEHPPVRNERKEERSNKPHLLDRPERQLADDRAPPNKVEARKHGFSSSGRYRGNGGNDNYRGRDKFNGRQGYSPSKTRFDKWKHDLYQEVNKDRAVQNEDDRIAKLEALLAP